MLVKMSSDYTILTPVELLWQVWTKSKLSAGKNEAASQNVKGGNESEKQLANLQQEKSETDEAFLPLEK